MATKEIQKAQSDSISELTEWGNFAVKAGILPTGVNAWQAMAMIQTGKEIGLQPMAAIRSMNFIKGRLTMSVQLQLALARKGGVEIVEMKDGDGKCEVTLSRDEQKITCFYTLEMAKKAGIVGKDNWTNYPAQMLRWRALGDALRLIASDLTLNLLSSEEAEDMETPFGLDPSAEVAVTPEQIAATQAESPITLEQRKRIMQEMVKNHWMVDGRATPDAVAKLGELGYENSNQIPGRDFDRVLKAFSEPAPAGIVA